MAYDKNNIFAKILTGEIPCEKIYENEYILSFYDINPQKKIHALVIPKGEYTDFDDFSSRASDKEIIELIKGITFVEFDSSDVVRHKLVRQIIEAYDIDYKDVGIKYMHFIVNQYL